MPAFTKLAVFAIAHAMLFGGCAAQVEGNMQVLYETDSEAAKELEEDAFGEEGPSAERPAALYYYGHEGVEQAGLEQWLTFVDLSSGEPIAALTVCEPAREDGNDPACAETDSEGSVLTHWTPEDQTYRMLGSLPDGTEFVLTELAAADQINRLSRPVGVMTETALEACYATAGVKLEAGRHTLLARARTGRAVAEDVRFTLHALDCEGALAEQGCTGEAVADGKDDAAQAQSTALGHGLFLDVAPGRYELRGERDGVPCSHAEVWLDGETGQVLAPELDCE